MPKRGCINIPIQIIVSLSNKFICRAGRQRPTTTVLAGGAAARSATCRHRDGALAAGTACYDGRCGQWHGTRQQLRRGALQAAGGAFAAAAKSLHGAPEEDAEPVEEYGGRHGERHANRDPCREGQRRQRRPGGIDRERQGR